MDVIKFKAALDTVREDKDLAPKIDDDGTVLETFCNIGLDRIMALIPGMPRMLNKLNNRPFCANDMCECMANSPSRYAEVTGEVACARAAQGILVIACQQEAGHGHVAAVYPAPMAWSASWAKQVPVLNNIGKINGVLRASQCFRTEPKYYSTPVTVQPPEPPLDAKTGEPYAPDK